MTALASGMQHDEDVSQDAQRHKLEQKQRSAHRYAGLAARRRVGHICPISDGGQPGLRDGAPWRAVINAPAGCGIASAGATFFWGCQQLSDYPPPLPPHMCLCMRGAPSWPRVGPGSDCSDFAPRAK